MEVITGRAVHPWSRTVPSDAPTVCYSSAPNLREHVTTMYVSCPALRTLSVSTVSRSSFTRHGSAATLVDSERTYYLIVSTQVPIGSSDDVVLS